MAECYVCLKESDLSPTECYVCLEECDHKSPCQCQATVHEKCLHAVKQYNRKRCTICRNRFDDESSDSSEDDEEEPVSSCVVYARCYTLVIFVFLIYVVVNFMLTY